MWWKYGTLKASYPLTSTQWAVMCTERETGAYTLRKQKEKSEIVIKVTA